MTTLTQRRAGLGRASVASLPPSMLVLPPALVTGALWSASSHASEFAAVACSWLLLQMAWGGFLCWHMGERRGVPVFALVTAAYWVYFGLALHAGAREVPIFGAAHFAIPAEPDITFAMLVAVAGVSSMWFGMRASHALAPGMSLKLTIRNDGWRFVRVLLLMTLALKLYPGAPYLLGGGGRQLMLALTATVPTVALVLLLQRRLSRGGSRQDDALLALTAAVFVVDGLASGWLTPIIRTGVIAGAVLLTGRRRIPWLAVATVVGLYVFLQAGKDDFRKTYWNVEHDASMTERAGAWVGYSAKRWGAVGDSRETRGDSRALVDGAIGRLALLPQVARVLEMTPRDVPFQEGDSYRYAVVSLIPRALWPDKPVMSDANGAYQVLYGLTPERDLNRVSIAAGSLAEGYMNFGLSGALGVMLLIGLILGAYDAMLAATSSDLVLAVGLALLPELLIIESQLGQYLGGVVQLGAVALLVFLPATNVFVSSARRSRQLSSRHAEAASAR